MSPPQMPWEEQEEGGTIGRDIGRANTEGLSLFLGEKIGGSMWGSDTLGSSTLQLDVFELGGPIHGPGPILPPETVDPPEEEPILVPEPPQAVSVEYSLDETPLCGEDDAVESPSVDSSYITIGILASDEPVAMANACVGSQGDKNALMSSIDGDFIDFPGTFEKTTFAMEGLNTLNKDPLTGTQKQTISASFSLPAGKKNIALVSYTFIDLEETNKRIGTNYTNRKRILGSTYEPIVSSGAPNRKATITNSKGKKSTITDIRIKDYHSLKKLTDIDTSLVPLTSEQILSPIREFAVSFDSTGGACFVFDLDTIAALKQLSFGSIFSRNISSSIKNEILYYAKILSMEVIRNRVDLPVDSQEESVVIASSFQKNNRSLLVSNTYKIRERNNSDGLTLGSIFEMNMQSSSDIRTFSGMDYSLPKEGKYVYTVRVSMVDAISAFLKNKLAMLKAASRASSDWAQEVSGPNYSDSSRKTFSYNGSKKIRKKYKNKNTPIETAVAIYSDIAGNIFDAAPETEIIDIMYPMINSVTGNPDGTNAVASAIKSLESKMYTLLGSNVSSIQSSTEKSSGPSGARSKGAPPEFEKTFTDQVLDASLASTGYIFIDRTSSDQGISILSKDTYNKRLNDEIASYSDAEVVSIPAGLSDTAGLSSAKISSLSNLTKTLPTYLTPSSIVSSDEVFDLSKTNKWDEELTTAAAESLRAQKSFGDTTGRISLQLLGAIGITCEIFNNKREGASSIGTFAVDSEDDGSIFSSTDNFASKNIEESSAPWPDEKEVGSTNEIASTLSPILVTGLDQGPAGPNLSLFDNNSSESIIDKLNLSEIQALPPQIKCLFLSNSDDTKVNWIESSPAALDVSFNSIARIETLSYSKDVNGNAISEWKPLLQSALGQTDNRTIRCRITNYSNSKIGIGQKDDIAFPILNNQFVIGGSNISKSRNTKKSSTPQSMSSNMQEQNNVIINDLASLGMAALSSEFCNNGPSTGDTGLSAKKETSSSRSTSQSSRTRTAVSRMGGY
tara:strand:+ start:2790 stop:5837 length:3048 start_codon:yes stop_codon:yes gene_type:complete